MKALVYEKAHSLADFAIKLVEVPVSTLRKNDVLVDLRAIGVNPGEAAIREHAQRRAGRPRSFGLGLPGIEGLSRLDHHTHAEWNPLLDRRDNAKAPVDYLLAHTPKASGILGEGRHKAQRLSHQIRPERVNAGQSTSTRIGKAT
jgi:hypothetical protein